MFKDQLQIVAKWLSVPVLPVTPPPVGFSRLPTRLASGFPSHYRNIYESAAAHSPSGWQDGAFVLLFESRERQVHLCYGHGQVRFGRLITCIRRQSRFWFLAVVFSMKFALTGCVSVNAKRTRKCEAASAGRSIISTAYKMNSRGADVFPANYTSCCHRVGLMANICGFLTWAAILQSWNNLFVRWCDRL